MTKRPKGLLDGNSGLNVSGQKRRNTHEDEDLQSKEDTKNTQEHSQEPDDDNSNARKNTEEYISFKREPEEGKNREDHENEATPEQQEEEEEKDGAFDVMIAQPKAQQRLRNPSYRSARLAQIMRQVNQVNSDFNMHHDLGSGRFGSIKYAENKSNANQKTAIKVIPKSFYSADVNYQEDLKEKFTVYDQLAHPNLLRVHDMFQDDKNIYIAMEYIEEDNQGLRQQILNNDPPLTHGEVLQIVVQILPLLKYLENTNIMHRDLTPMHILTKREADNQICAKLTGFQCAANVEQQAGVLTKKPKYASGLFKAPELLQSSKGSCVHNSKVDVWSLGVCLFMLLSGAHPFSDKPKEQLMASVYDE